MCTWPSRPSIDVEAVLQQIALAFGIPCRVVSHERPGGVPGVAGEHLAPEVVDEIGPGVRDQPIDQLPGGGRVPAVGEPSQVLERGGSKLLCVVRLGPSVGIRRCGSSRLAQHRVDPVGELDGRRIRGEADPDLLQCPVL